MQDNLARVLEADPVRRPHLALVEDVAREDERMRAQIDLSQLDPSAFEFSVATTVEEYKEALTLVHAAYAEKGYEPKDAWEMRLTSYHLLRECVVVVARQQGKVVGTMTIFGDSAVRLPLDRSYPGQIEALRREQGVRLTEAGCLTVVPEHRRSGLNTLLGLIGQAVAQQLLGGTHMVIGVNPVALPFYRAIFNFRAMGAFGDHHELTAPQIGLVWDAEQQRDFLSENFRAPHLSGMSVCEALWDRILDHVKMPEALRRGGVAAWSAAARLRFHLLRLLPQPKVSDRVVIAHALRQPLAAPERALRSEEEQRAAA